MKAALCWMVMVCQKEHARGSQMFGWHFPCCIDQAGGRLQHTPKGDAECKAVAASMALLRFQVRRTLALDPNLNLNPNPYHSPKPTCKAPV